MPQIEFAADNRRLLCDVLVLPPDGGSDLSGFRGTALIDTGATVSGLGPGPIEALSLRSYGKKPLGSATEERMVDYYLFGLATELPSIDGSPRWPYLFERSDGSNWQRKMAFDVIIGMDVLLQCDLRLSPLGRCTLRFGS